MFDEPTSGSLPARKKNIENYTDQLRSEFEPDYRLSVKYEDFDRIKVVAVVEHDTVDEPKAAIFRFFYNASPGSNPLTQEKIEQARNHLKSALKENLKIDCSS